MLAILNSFGESKKYEGRTIINVSTEAVDDLTGLKYKAHRSYLVVGSFYFTNFISQEVELTLVKSPKLGFDVCTGIKLVQTSTDQPASLDTF